MHHISGGHWHFITVELYFGPTECIWSGEEGLSPATCAPAPPLLPFFLLLFLNVHGLILQF